MCNVIPTNELLFGGKKKSSGNKSVILTTVFRITFIGLGSTVLDVGI